jgi:type II secretion system protein C
MGLLDTLDRRTLGLAVAGACATGWGSAFATAQLGSSLLALPQGAELAALDTTAPPEGEGPGPDGAEPGAELPGPPRPLPRSRGGDPDAYVDPIVKRSLFDPSKVGADAAGEAAATGEERRSDLRVVLLATLVAEPAVYSSALIAEEKGEAGALGYGIGDDILGEGTIHAIESGRVYIKRRDGALEFIDMGGTYQKTPSTDGPKAGPGGDEEEEGVTQAGPNKFVIEKEVLDKLLENPEQLYSQVRAVPHKGPDGQVDGYRLSGIRRKSLFYKLGVKNGDIIHSVNGKSLDSMGNAMDAYNSMQGERNFNFELTRRNKRETFEYEVR